MTVLFCDLDGVLTDFEAGVAALFGRELPPGPERVGQDTATALGLASGQMWARIQEAGRPFWEKLPPTAEADELVALLRQRGELCIASAPSIDPASADGKVRWLQRRFGRRFRDLVLTSRKELLAAPGRVLIDDRLAAVTAFTDAGGCGLLWPTWANGARAEHADPLAYLQAELDR